MPLFMCRVCGCVENTALGNYWSAGDRAIWKDEDVGKPTCSECAPKFYEDGTPTEYGKWHGRFPKQPATGMLIDQDGHLWSIEESLPKHYKIVGAVLDGSSAKS